MKNDIRFFVPGLPAPGGSKKAFVIKKGGVYTGRVAVVDDAGQANKNWRACVAQVAVGVMKERAEYPWEGPIGLELIFQLPRPKGHFKTKGGLRGSAPNQHITRPDVGKLARSTQDALKNIVWRDDSQVVKETHEKAFSKNAGCWVTVRDASLGTPIL